MIRIDKNELMEIVESYGLDDLIFDTSSQVEPDTTLYFFHDKKNTNYCLIASDYLDGDIKLPCNFKYDYYPDHTVEFKAVQLLSYTDNAKKKADGYIDDEHYRTKASNGDVCMLFIVDELKI